MRGGSSREAGWGLKSFIYNIGTKKSEARCVARKTQLEGEGQAGRAEAA